MYINDYIKFQVLAWLIPRWSACGFEAHRWYRFMDFELARSQPRNYSRHEKNL